MEAGGERPSDFTSLQCEWFVSLRLASGAGNVIPGLVSVIVPTYNRASYLVETLSSVCSQTYEDYEVIVVDDGSTDNTFQSLAPYRSRVRYVYQKNAGRSVARNLGIRRSLGEYLLFLDSDDLLEPTALECQVGALAARPEVDAVYCNGSMLFEDGRFGPLEPLVVPLPGLDRLEMTRRILVQCFIPPVTLLLRRRVLDCTAAFDPRAEPVEDWDLWVRLVCQGAYFAYNHAHVAVYRKHAGNSNAIAPTAHVTARTWICHQVVSRGLDRDLPARLRQDFRLEHIGAIVRSRDSHILYKALLEIVRPDGVFSRYGLIGMARRVLRLPAAVLRRLPAQWIPRAKIVLGENRIEFLEKQRTSSHFWRPT